MGPVLVVRNGSPADKLADGDKLVHAPNPTKSLEGDLIEAVSVIDADGKPLVFKGDTLDPERLPFELRQWSDRMDKAKKSEPWIVTIQLRRHRAEPGVQFEPKEVKLTWDKSWRFDRVEPFSSDAPMPIPELGLAYQIKTTVAAVIDPNSPLKVGDVVKNIQVEWENFGEEGGKRPWMKKTLESGQWASLAFRLFQQDVQIKKLEFKVERGKEEVVVVIPIKTDPTWPLAERGWHLERDTRRVKASSVPEAIAMGLKDTRNRMWEVFQSLRGIVTGRIAVDNIGGPFMIADAAYRFAGLDFGEFVFFLGLISINLAVVN